VRELAESRTLAKQALTQAEAADVPPYLSVANPQPPSGPDEHGAASRGASERRSVLKRLHASTLEYWEEVRAHRDRVAEKWQKPLLKVGYPVAGEWEPRPTRHGPPAYVRPLGSEPAVVALDTLGQWRFNQVTLGWRRTTRRGREETTRAEKVYLPPLACQRVFEQLNDVLDELGLSAAVRDATSSDTDPGVPDDIDAWGRAETGERP